MDSEIVIAYAKTQQLGELENFISGTHQANLQARLSRRRGALALSRSAAALSAPLGSRCCSACAVPRLQPPGRARAEQRRRETEKETTHSLAACAGVR